MGRAERTLGIVMASAVAAHGGTGRLDGATRALEKARITLRKPRKRRRRLVPEDSVVARARFPLGSPVAFTTEETQVFLGPFHLVIPPGAFRRKGRKKLVAQGLTYRVTIVPGSPLNEIRIEAGGQSLATAHDPVGFGIAFRANEGFLTTAFREIRRHGKLVGLRFP